MEPIGGCRQDRSSLERKSNREPRNGKPARPRTRRAIGKGQEEETFRRLRALPHYPSAVGDRKRHKQEPSPRLCRCDIGIRLRLGRVKIGHSAVLPIWRRSLVASRLGLLLKEIDVVTGTAGSFFHSTRCGLAPLRAECHPEYLTEVLVRDYAWLKTMLTL